MRQLNIIRFKFLFLTLTFLLSVFFSDKAVASGGVLTPDTITKDDIEIVFPSVLMTDLKSEVLININDDNRFILDYELEVLVNGESKKIVLNEGIGSFEHIIKESGDPLKVSCYGFEYVSETTAIPLWMSILPPLIAIFMALIFKEVFSSLFIGIFIGGGLIGVYTHGLQGLFTGLMAVLDTYIVESLYSEEHISVIIFSMLIGGIVSIIGKNGGIQGVVEKISKYAKDAKSGQLATWLLGVLIFFDDYANTLVVGNTMRPLTDKLRISREKLSYIVDSTAAPVAAIAFVTTWIGAELGYIEDSIQSFGIEESAYSIFLNSLSYSFYPIFTLVFILMLVLSGNDYGPMYKAEVRARTTGNVIPNSTQYKSADESESSAEIESELDDLKSMAKGKNKGFNAVIPIAVLIFGAIAGLVYTGYESASMDFEGLGFSRKLSMIIGASDPYAALLWSSLGGLLVAVLLSVSQNILTLSDSMEAMMKGFKTMFSGIIILVLAWALALVAKDLHTADYITSTMLAGGVMPVFLPVLTFLLSALIAFSTGSSWGSMAILYPLMLPATWQVCLQNGLDQETMMMIFYNVVSCVLAGSVLGDHCSPISDTTILSSIATSCDHIEHVRTQLPYAITVGIVSVFCGVLPAAMGLPSIFAFIMGLAVLFFWVRFFGKKVE